MNWFRLWARMVLAFSCDPRRFYRALLAWPQYLSDLVGYYSIRREQRYQRFPIRLGDLHPFLLDRSDSAGTMGVYFHQDLHVARLIHQRKPVTHLDVGSRVDGFVSHLLTFMDVTSIDVRPLTEIKGMKCIDADARALDMFPDGSVPSLSCLHSLEHFGLGRYGDEVDPLAWEKALSEMIRVLAPRGCFYLSVPVGKERVEFNAQRVFSIDTVLKALDELNVVCVTLIGQDGLIRQVGDIRMLYEAKQDEGEGTVAVFEALKSYQSSG